jgi:para-nitrobenzyl esterase
MNTRNATKALAVVLVLATVSIHAQSPVKVETGQLQGVTADGVISYKGIPFAQPPVGPLRWRAPQPASRWKGVRSAADYGHDCMQLPFPSDAAPLGTAPSEDCLVLNVWRPADTSTKLPVMVWIYGGGFVNGGSSPAVYDGSQFARQGIVFVSFNYRLGRFGFFAHPALTAEANGTPTGNFAILDQIAALKWIKQNIKSFGGDPDRVTIFGESAGGGSVLALLTSPLSRGLFQQAMIESGGGRDGLTGMTLLHDTNSSGKPSAESKGIAFAKAKGITDEGPAGLKQLRLLPADDVVDKLNMASMNAAAPTYPGMIIDGQIILGTPQTVFLAGGQAKVPLVIGANDADAGFAFFKSLDEVFASFRTSADQARAAYNPDGTRDLRTVGAMVGMDRGMIEPARFIAATVAASGQPAYEYRFSYVAKSMRSQWPGAPHATEIPFVFDTVRAKYGAALDPADEATAQAANKYWGAFVRTGKPEVPGLPAWEPYNPTTDMLLNFTPDGPVFQMDPLHDRLNLIEAARTQH